VTKGVTTVQTTIKAIAVIPLLLASQVLRVQAQKSDADLFPQPASFTTLITTPRAIEGLTGDNNENLYLGGSGAPPCPIWKVNIHNPALTVVGNISAALTSVCTFRGIAFDATGNLFVSDPTLGRIYRVTPNAAAPPDATLFASGVPGTNGLAFDRYGNLWTGDGTTRLGRIWKVTASGANCAPPGMVNCTEVFRVQPMRNSTLLGGNVSGDGVGRQARDFPPGTITIASGTFPVTPVGGQDLVANGLAFDSHGDLFIIDTARGALWKAEFDQRGTLTSPTGCDQTFTENTLCLSNVVAAHPILEGGDGIILDRGQNIWVAANERNAIALISQQGGVFEVFRNPINALGLRNSADPTVGNNHILEFPTSPVLNGTVFCTANSDLDRRDNSPAVAGEINGTTVLGKISCMDQPAVIPGLPLPVR
jgi:sugar lactone lactonase YvrE